MVFMVVLVVVMVFIVVVVVLVMVFIVVVVVVVMVFVVVVVVVVMVAMRALGFEVKKAQVQEIMRSYDKQNTGFITQSDFEEIS
ncbi:centrin, putative [Eimeria mitis]|uniref:Centrin, putative n=1 Tax=Eimeria mitis TaxID=44415 RepID=U6K888_9EIME|nr:centrin, putative [Eimeria mitis]CDJ34225.1 centrin, putative [Eimeria mitis]